MSRLLLLTATAKLAGVLALTFGRLRLVEYLPILLLGAAKERDVVLPASVHREKMELKVLTYDPPVIYVVGLVSLEERVYLIFLAYVRRPYNTLC